MKKYRCPHCEKETVNLWLKLSAIPGLNAVKCPECEGDICADYGERLVCWVPMLLGCWLLRYVEGVFARVLVLFGFAAVSLVWSAVSAQLITKEEFTAKKRQKTKKI